MTAEEFFNKWNLENYFQSDNEYQRLALMKDFAKYHVEQALKSASENAYVMNHTECLIDRADILNAYPLENIK